MATTTATLKVVDVVTGGAPDTMLAPIKPVPRLCRASIKNPTTPMSVPPTRVETAPAVHIVVAWT